MTDSTLDTSLTLPGAPEALPRLGTAPAGLELSTPAGPSPFLIGGGRATVTGPQLMPVDAVLIDGLLVAKGVSAHQGRPANIGLSPGRLRREWVGGSGTSMEIVIASQTLPLVAIQWARPGGSAKEVAFTLLPEAGRLRYNAGAGSVVAVSAGAPDDRAAVTVSPASAQWSIEPAPGGGLRVTIQSEQTEVVTLLATRGSGAAVAATLDAARHLGAHERLSADYRPEGGLTVSSGVKELDDGIAWARARVDAGSSGPLTARGPTADPNSILWSGIGALAAGDPHAARRAIEAIGNEDAWPYGALLAGKLALLTGDSSVALRLAGMASRAGAPATGGTPEAQSLTPAALEAVADGLQHSAPDQLIAALRNTEPGTADVERGRRLPMLAPTTGADGLGGWLARALAGEPPTRAPAVAGLSPMLSAWGLSGSDPDRAWVDWRAILSRGLRDGAMGPGSWDAWLPHSTWTPVAGVVLATFVHGFLGVAPDAAVGRIRIGPRLPGHIRSLEVSGLTVGDAAIALSYERVGSRHLFTLAPQRGRVPPVAIFQPEVPGKVTRIRVDGAEADLKTSSGEGGRSRVSAQIPVDTHRTVEVETG